MTRTRQRRNKGEGSITRTPNGRYKATITIGVGLDGKQKRKSITRDTKREVIEAVALLKASYGKDTKGRASKKTLKEVCDEFIDTKSTQLSASSLKSYKNHIRSLLMAFGSSILMRSITKNMIEDYFKTRLRDNQLKASSLKRTKAVWSVLMKYSIQQGYIDTNPVKEASVPFPRVVPKANTMTLPSTIEFDKLIKVAMEKSRWYGVLLFLASVTGMRRGELLGLKWTCVHEDTKTITINNQIDIKGMDAPLKTPSSYRTIYVTPKAFEKLDTLPRTSTYVFSSTRHPTRAISRATLEIYNREVFKKAGMPKGFTFHDIRHYHATQLLQRGINPKVVSRRLGHASISTTLNLYFNYLPSMDEEASVALDD